MCRRQQRRFGTSSQDTAGVSCRLWNEVIKLRDPLGEGDFYLSLSRERARTHTFVFEIFF